MANRTHTGTKAPTKTIHPKKRTPAKASRPVNGGGQATVRMFVSYSHKDSDAQQQLQVHLAPLVRDGVSIWYDGDLNAGDELDASISRELRQADIFVALLSPDYLHSHYCWNIEYKKAMGRRARGTMQVVAVVVRPCDWLSTRAANFKLLPRDGRAVTKWRSSDEAFLNVTQGLRGVVKALRKQAMAPAARSVRQPAKTVSKKTPVAKPRNITIAKIGKSAKAKGERKQRPVSGKRR